MSAYLGMQDFIVVEVISLGGFVWFMCKLEVFLDLQKVEKDLYCNSLIKLVY